MKVMIAQKDMHTGNSTRGVGVYARELSAALQKYFPEDDFGTISKPDVIHYPYFDPFSLTLRPSWHIPTVVTIHDLIPLRFPTHFPSGLRGKIKWWIQRMRVQRVAHILTDSEASKRDIVKLIGIGADKVSVIPLGPNSAESIPSRMAEKVAKRYQLPAKYLLYVGDINWNKNVPGLIQMFSALKERDVFLVLVGKVFADQPDIPEWQGVQEAIASCPHKERIMLLGYVPTHHLAVLYTRATLYVQPSWYEGFGLTILEAMKFGCPVATSNRGSLPEVGGGAVAYFDPGKDMGSVIAALLKDQGKRARLALLGQQEALHFTWERTARLTHKVYEHVLAART